jgi:hypothetical protein
MHEHHINDMVNKLVKAGIIPEKQKNKAKKTLDTYWEDKIALIWQEEDVIQRAEQLNGTKISKEKAQDILQEILDNHDCTVGVTWETIDYYVTRED